MRSEKDQPSIMVPPLLALIGWASLFSRAYVLGTAGWSALRFGESQIGIGLAFRMGWLSPLPDSGRDVLREDRAAPLEHGRESVHPGHALVWDNIKDVGCKPAMRVRIVQAQPFSFADLALNAGDSGVPARETIGIGQQGPDSPSGRSDVDRDAANEGEGATFLG